MVSGLLQINNSGEHNLDAMNNLNKHAQANFIPTYCLREAAPATDTMNILVYLKAKTETEWHIYNTIREMAIQPVDMVYYIYRDQN